jgi:hypothetical protein
MYETLCDYVDEKQGGGDWDGECAGKLSGKRKPTSRSQGDGSIDALRL